MLLPTAWQAHGLTLKWVVPTKSPPSPSPPSPQEARFESLRGPSVAASSGPSLIPSLPPAPIMPSLPVVAGVLTLAALALTRSLWQRWRSAASDAVPDAPQVPLPATRSLGSLAMAARQLRTQPTGGSRAAHASYEAHDALAAALHGEEGDGSAPWVPSQASRLRKLSDDELQARIAPMKGKPAPRTPLQVCACQPADVACSGMVADPPLGTMCTAVC
jgi:hypothetical protein